MNNIELITLDGEETWEDIELALDNKGVDIKKINIYGHLLPYIKLLDTIPSVYIHTDFPHMVHDIEVQKVIIDTYSTNNLVTGFNIVPPYESLLAKDWGLFEKQLTEIVKVCIKNKKEYRFLMSAGYVENNEELFKVANILEQLDFERYLLAGIEPGVEDEDMDDFLIDCAAIQKQLNIKVGVAGDFHTKERIETLVKSPFSPILLLPDNIRDLL